MTEFIGFIISVLSLIYFSTRQNSSPSIPKKKEEDLEEEQEEDEPFLEWIEGVNKKSHPLKRPPPLPKKEIQSSVPIFKQVNHPKLNKHVIKKEVAQPLLYRELEQPKAKVSRAQQAVKQLPHLNHLVIYQEIIGPPKSMRPDQ
jgi:hypothetical protein